MPIKLALLDDHQIVIDGLKLLLEGMQSIHIVAESTDGNELLAQFHLLEVDILLTDVMMPAIDGFEMSLKMREQFPDVKIIALSMNGEGPLVDKMILEAKIDGYLLKTANRNELLKAIEVVAEGDTYFAQEIIDELHLYSKIKKQNEEVHLTARELEIITCIAKDLSNKQIADQLFISERTVETHRKNIFRKTDIHSAIGLIEYAKKQKLI
jgi:two-component system, NarL family, nitrate/nitrite response regulator NarL